VGGHCIGVDPYYLVHKAKEVGYDPHVIASGRKVNDFMPTFVAEQTEEGLQQAGKNIAGARVLVVGLTFKENVKDIRNSKIATTIEVLRHKGAVVEAYDPLLTPQDITHEPEFNGLTLVENLNERYDAVIIATTHDAIKTMDKTFIDLMDVPVLVDIKEYFPAYRHQENVIYKSL
jgi:UDP-N-acetyl-D-galactosamine dehydrogenase